MGGAGCVLYPAQVSASLLDLPSTRTHARTRIQTEYCRCCSALLLQKYHASLEDWEWRFGKTPAFSHEMETRFEWGLVDFHLDVAKGVVTQAQVFSDGLYPEFVEAMNAALVGVPYDAAGIEAAATAATAALEGSEAQGQVRDAAAWLQTVI